jgi:drug/metabolite transporter (DMT)-like permease
VVREAAVDRRGGTAASAVPLALLGATVLIWGTGFWPTGVAAGHTTNLMLAGLRAIPSALVMLAAVPLLGASLPRGRMLVWTVLTGLIMPTLFQWGATEAIGRAGPGNAAVLLNTTPLFVLVVGWVALGERASLVGVGGLLAGFGGVVLMVWSQLGGDVETGQLLAGTGLALAAAIGWGTGTLVLKHLSLRGEHVDWVGVNAVQYAVAAVVIAPVAFAVDGTAGTDWEASGLWGPLVWIGPVNALGAMLFLLALGRLPASRTSSVLFLVPAVAVLVEIARGAAPEAIVLAGMVLAVGGVALVITAGERQLPLRRLLARR